MQENQSFLRIIITARTMTPMAPRIIMIAKIHNTRALLLPVVAGMVVMMEESWLVMVVGSTVGTLFASRDGSVAAGMVEGATVGSVVGAVEGSVEGAVGSEGSSGPVEGALATA